jgi:hypothetical protein
MHTNYLKGVIAGLALASLVCSQAQPPASPQGVITAKTFLNIGGGTAVADLTGNAKFPDSPDILEYIPYFEMYATGDINTPPAGDVYNNMGGQIIGYFYPPTAGDYVFYVGADDGANLYLSTDATAANKKLIAQESGWSGVRNFTGVGGGSTVEAKCSQTFTGTEWATKDPAGGAKITLQANRAYYIEALFKEGGGGDNLAVSVQDPGFAIDATMPIPGQYLATIDKQSGPATIVTPPQSLTVNEGQPAAFTVVVNGTPPYAYQWKKNGTDIAGATGESYTLDRAYRADNGAKFSVVVTGAQGTATSPQATLTVTTDATAPTLVSAKGSVTFDSVVVEFSEPVDPVTGAVAANFKVSGGVTVVSAALYGAPGTADDNKVLLLTSKQAEGATLTVTVSNVKDVPGNTIAANSQVSFKTFVWAPGFVLHKFWDNVAANNIGSLTGDARFPDAPSWVTIEPRWEYPPNGRNEGGSNYGNQISGWFMPAVTGSYVFFTCSDDPSELRLSTDADPANKKLIAFESGWSGARTWVGVGGGSTLEDKRSDSYGGTEWPDGNTINLMKGQKYYMESLHTEGGGGDNVGATFILVGENDPQNGDAPTLAGALIGTYLDPTGASVSIDQPPQDTQAQEGRTAIFTVVATGTSAYGNTVSYQWQKAPPGSATFTDISGATLSSYETPLLALANSGAKYRVVCSVPTVVETSVAATLTVVPDTFPPKLAGAGSVMKGTAIEIGVEFDEDVDAATASTAANYTLSKGTVTGVRYQKFAHWDGTSKFVLGATGPFSGCAVVLTTAGLAGGDKVTVTAKNVKDVKGNPISATGESKSLTVTKTVKWAAMGGDDYVEGNLAGMNIDPNPALWPDDVVAVGEADFYLISSGTANWNNYDEATFVYESVTGDFDKVVRVEYHDPTSQWARAGLCATPAADEGMNRAAVDGGAQMERRFMQRANPPVQWNGSGGNNMYEADWRLTKGGNYGGTGGGTPAYPNAWMRMQRVGQVFTALYSNDGKNWTTYGSATFTDEPMPATLLVGPYYSPEFNNNTTGEGVGHSSVAKFRNYGTYVSKPSQVEFAIGLNFGADEPNGANGGILPSVGTAGVPGVIQANWNNLSGATGSAADLAADSKGTAQATTASVSWTCPNTWSSTGRGEENNKFTENDFVLMTGYLDTGGATTTQVTITGIPADLTDPGYDVYVYILGGVGGRGGGYRIVDAANPATVLKDYVNAQPPLNPTAYTEVVPQAGAWATGSYLKFTGLKASGIIVEATTEGGHAYGGVPRAPMNAIQLVKATAVQPAPTLSVALNAQGMVVLTFEGTLQAADVVEGPYVDIAGTSPLTVAPTGKKFYRAKR